MKIFYKITLLLSLTSCNLFSQTDSTTQKGRLFVSGTIGIEESSSKYISGNSFERKNTFTNFNLSMGIFSKNNVANIFSIGISDITTSPISNSGKGYFLGYDREYYKMFSKKFGIYGGAGFNTYYNSERNFNEQIISYPNSIISLLDISETTRIRFNIGAYPGIIYFLNPKWAFSLRVGNINLISLEKVLYKTSQDKLNNNDKTTTTSDDVRTFYSFNPYIALGNSAIGIRYHFK